MDGFKRPSRVPQPEQPQSNGTDSHVQPESAPLSSRLETPDHLPRNESNPPTSEDLPPIILDDEKAPVSSKRSKTWLRVGLVVAVFLFIVGSIFFFWYQGQLKPVNPADDSVQRVEITEGLSLGYIADRLEERGLVRSSLAFTIMTNISGKQSAIKAGTCELNPSYSSKEILDKITAGCHDFKSVTFYPGATLESSLYAKTRAASEGEEFKDMSIRASLKAAGYDDTAINQAFSNSYDSPLFEGKPASEGYEGYVFGETYYVATDASATEVLQTAFDHFYEVVTKNDLVAKYNQQGLTLYEGITLASIVGRELDCEGKPTEERKQTCYGYQRQIAEVFYNRLEAGMSLGSDVTSIYASDILNQPPSIDIDSPYNTRRYSGLTPGPIATAGELALLSVANPTEGDKLYFLAGDDGLIYFASDNAGHEANIVNHCQKGCGDL